MRNDYVKSRQSKCCPLDLNFRLIVFNLILGRSKKVGRFATNSLQKWTRCAHFRHFQHRHSFQHRHNFPIFASDLGVGYGLGYANADSF